MLRNHYVDFLAVAAGNFTEYTGVVLEPTDRTVNFTQEEYDLLNGYWGNVFLTFCRKKGGKLKSIVGDTRIKHGQRTF